MKAWVQYGSLAASVSSVAYSGWSAQRRWSRQAGRADWPDSDGLCGGLAAVVVAQVAIVVYQYWRRFSIVAGAHAHLIQKQETAYERSFAADVARHLSNPGAFLLMLPYLCLTWWFRLMPESYYDWGRPVSWPMVLAQLLVVDFFTFSFHVAQHALPALYKRSHKPHHRFTRPQLFNAFDGSLVDTVMLILFPLFTTAQLLPASNWDYIAFGTVYSSHFMLIHSEFSHVWDPLLSKFMVNVAEDHHVHHATFKSNFGHFFTVFDRVAGTYRAGRDCPGFQRTRM